MGLITTYKVGSKEECKLQIFARVANKVFLEHKKAIYISVENTYFDYGQDWKYTALITEDMLKNSTWQTVCPRDYENIIVSDSVEEISEWATKYALGLIEGNICQHLTF